MYPLAKIQISIFFLENDDCPNQMLDKKPFRETKKEVCFYRDTGACYQQQYTQSCYQKIEIFVKPGSKVHYQWQCTSKDHTS